MRRALTMMLALFLLAACQQEAVRPANNSAAEIDDWFAGRGDATGVPGAAPAAEKPKGPVVRAREDGPAWDWSDPCVENLQDLEGLLLLYYQQNHEMPASLADLKGKSPDDEKVSLVCPASGKAYVYNRMGLIPPADIVPEPQRARGGDRLIVYDAEAAHEITQHLTDGTKDWDVKKMVRYGIVMKPPGTDGTLTLQVVPVEQALLDAYLRETRAEANKTQVAPVKPLPRPDAGGLW
jgi:hypothetical protein